MSIPSQYTKSQLFEADEIKIPVEILVMHDKKNLNQSNFELEAIELAKESIKNIPILGYVRKIEGSDSKDFAGHEMELTIKDGNIKIVYLEKPIGVIPETNNYEYVEIDGKTFVKVTGYIWKEYLNEGYQVLLDNPEKSVSMEITVDDYAINKDGVFDIKAYRYLGVTVLGDNYSPAMEGANMKVIENFNTKFSNDFYEKVESLNQELKLEFNTINDLNIDNISIEEGGIENMSEVNNENITFSATYNQKREALRNALDPIIVKDNEDKVTEETYFWVSDFDDEYVYAEKSYWTATEYDCTYGRVKYVFDEVTITATVDMESWEKMIRVWLTESENQKIQEDRNTLETMSIDFEALQAEVETYKASITGLESEKKILNTKISDFELVVSEKDKSILELQEYQNTKETEIKTAQIDEIISDFEVILADNEEFEIIKKTAHDYEILDLEKELFALEGKVNHAKNTKSNKKSQTFNAKVSVEESDVKKSSYYGEAVKYIEK